MEQIMGTALLMMEGAQITLEIFCVTLLLSLPLGLLVALCRISKLGPLRLLMEFYIWLMRGTPLMLQLLFVYFALPMVGPISRRRSSRLRSTMRRTSRKSSARAFSRSGAGSMKQRSRSA